jgi:hypothetical protein
MADDADAQSGITERKMRGDQSFPFVSGIAFIKLKS